MFSQLGCVPFFLPVSLPGTYFFPCLLSLVCPFSFSHAFLPLRAYFFLCMLSPVCLFFFFACLFRFSGHTFSLASTLWYAFFPFRMPFPLPGAYFFSYFYSLVCLSFFFTCFWGFSGHTFSFTFSFRYVFSEFRMVNRLIYTHQGHPTIINFTW